jgi:hypothetical protein
MEIIQLCTENSDCDDNIFCNGVEYCDIICRSGPPPCKNESICNSQCNEETKNCYAPYGTSCDDGTWCNGLEYCDGNGNCLANSTTPCTLNIDNRCNTTCNEQERNCFAR